MKISLRQFLVIAIIVTCVVCLNLAVFFKFTEKEGKTANNKKDDIVNIDSTALEESFNSIFDNSIDTQENNISETLKKEASKELIYTAVRKNEQKTNVYDVNVNIPQININNTNVEKINKEINDVFYTKMNSIIDNKSDSKSVYTVNYKAYINNNILSLIINANLKEGVNSQRLIIKTYNYNLSSNQLLDLNQVVDYRGLDKNNVQTRIKEKIKESEKKSENYLALGYNKYLRNSSDEMYKIENTKTFFLGEGKALYIIYPYGNSNYTTEFDLLVI